MCLGQLGFQFDDAFGGGRVIGGLANTPVRTSRDVAG